VRATVRQHLERRMPREERHPGEPDGGQPVDPALANEPGCCDYLGSFRLDRH
jgi:hypothetical protein